jgi:hypothetical protein
MEKRVISQFEFAIMQAANESVENVRPETDAEIMRRKLQKEIDFYSKIKCRTPEDQKILDQTVELLQKVNI